MAPQTSRPRVGPGRAGWLPAALLAEREMIREATPRGEVPRVLMAAGRGVQEGGAAADRAAGMEGGAVAVPLYGNRPQGWRMGRAGAGGGAEVVAGAVGPGRMGPKVLISGEEQAQSCRELAESPRVAYPILGNDTRARLLSWSSCPATRTAAAKVRDTLCSGP